MEHNNPWRVRWDLLIILFVFFNSITIPFDAAFEPDYALWYQLLEVLVDVCFAIDILVNFRTTQETKFGLEKKPCNIAKNYIFGGRFGVDLMASIPFERVFELV